MNIPLWLVAAYFAGSFPTSYLAGRIAGIDLRQHGSKNLGATNVYRVLGWKYAVPVGLVDVAKGAVPVLLASARAGQGSWIPVVVGGAAVAGHVFSVFLKFRGGKGVATAAGAVLGLAPTSLAAAAVVWIAVLAGTGFVSLASIMGALTFPLAVRFLAPDAANVFWIGVALAAFIVFTHRANILRLLSGTENRFGRRSEARPKDP
ncbi:MAG: glycerol-3-phosphate 1-O-acyltransferase PlsY [Gemmatimonadota bacterium]|nr:glycerol-3-phosphate 1-O-acyltransferase PlsY [Gemmatimonadota bacterium]